MPEGQSIILEMQVERFGSEADLLTGFSEAVLALDPDIIVGWEVQQGSIGYLVDRAAILEMPLLRAMSRTPEVCFISRCQAILFYLGYFLEEAHRIYLT